ncbi:MAG TPA: GMC family oxidoreductase [Balneolaceae bacterium]|nr:GMC family oxidoreductase [Balneolaceae bacterium]
MQFKDPPKEYDVCIVGSGAGGGMAAKVLTEAGAEVLMLEAGPWYNTQRDSHEMEWVYESPTRGAPLNNPFGDFDAAMGGWEIDGEPYSSNKGSNFDWFRSRMLGGRTNHWGRVSLRYGPDDFRAASIDGLGVDWPISYKDIKPYYDRLDRLVGIFGTKENFHNSPDGIFMKPPPPRCYELYIKEKCKSLGIPVFPARLSIITETLNGRAPCHHCGQCYRGCKTQSNFSSPTVLIPPAMDTGNLKIINNAMVRTVTYNNGKATGVSYINKKDGKEYKVRSKIVVLAASSCSSARILLNSKSSDFPNGLANSSGAVGKYLMDNTGTTVRALIPKMMNRFPHNEDGADSQHIYIPWWLDNKKLDFPRGYHVEMYGGLDMPMYGFQNNIQNYNANYDYVDNSSHPKGGGGYGKQLKEDYRRFFGSFITFEAFGGTYGRKDNYCEIDPHKVDKYGIPTLKFNYTWTDHEFKQVRHAQKTLRNLVNKMRGTVFGDMPSEEEGYGIWTPGQVIHEVGTIRMGNDPKNSVLNKYCQTHDVDNLFVADGGPFVSVAHKNPTWTIMALSMRTSDYIIDQKKKGEI